jgi:hypothetical protein
MENSIELIWKQGFLNESNLVVPQVNDLYNQKSIHVVDRIKRRMKNYRTFNCILIFLILVSDYFLGIFWNGLAFTTVALFMLWYTKDIINSIKTLDQGATSYDYLKSFDSCLKDILAKSEKIVRFSLPLYCLIGFIGTWSVWSKLGVFAILQHRHPTINIPLVALAYLATSLVLVILFSAKMYRWEVRVVYGRLLDKLKETIAEMDKLKEGE